MSAYSILIRVGDAGHTAVGLYEVNDFDLLARCLFWLLGPKMNGLLVERNVYSNQELNE